jgi:hypothetical protein
MLKIKQNKTLKKYKENTTSDVATIDASSKLSLQLTTKVSIFSSSYL